MTADHVLTFLGIVLGSGTVGGVGLRGIRGIYRAARAIEAASETIAELVKLYGGLDHRVTTLEDQWNISSPASPAPSTSSATSTSSAPWPTSSRTAPTSVSPPRRFPRI